MKYHVEFDIDFKRNPYGGLYIALEGIDGSGKSTQIEALFKHFSQKGKDVIQAREPRKNEGPVGELIQKILHGTTQIPPVAFQYLFSAEREIHHAELITPSLKDNKIVISDRCFWSAIPYGILDREEQVDEASGDYMLVAQSILSLYHQFTLPDYTFYLKLPLDTAMERLSQGTETKEIYEDKKKLHKALKGYDWLLQKFPKEFTVIDATQPVEEITKEIISVIDKNI